MEAGGACDMMDSHSPALRRYRRAYRAAFDFHMRHSPPRVADGEAYFEEAYADWTRTCADFRGDAFALKLLLDAYLDLEQEFRRLRGDPQTENDRQLDRLHSIIWRAGGLFPLLIQNRYDAAIEGFIELSSAALDEVYSDVSSA